MRLELEHDSVRRDGFFFDKRAFRLDLYRLLSIFFANPEYARLGRSSDSDPLASLAEEFQETEMSRLLITIAATVRVIQDRERAPEALLNAPCGDFFPDAEQASQEALTLREACNKLIHATRFNFDVKPLPASERRLPNPTYVLRPKLHLYGSFRKARWKAVLDVRQFVAANAQLVHG